MITIHSLAASIGTISLSLAVFAVPVPYSNPGTPNPTTYSFTALSTGNVIAYFVGQTAGYGSDIGLSINGAPPATFGLQNHMAAYGDPFIMGPVTAGDVLRFVLRVSTTAFFGPPPVDYLLNSDPSLNPGGENHVFSYNYAGNTVIPAGIYVGIEDISPLVNGDLDYDDHQFVFTNIRRQVENVPEGSLPLPWLGLGVLCLLWLRHGHGRSERPEPC